MSQGSRPPGENRLFGAILGSVARLRDCVRSFWGWASGSILRSVLAWGIYLCLGVCLGVVWALLWGDDFGTPAVMGGVYGVLLARSHRVPAGEGADPAELQRSAVVRRAVQRGEAPSDPTLAEETIQLAQLRIDPPGIWTAWLVFCGIDAVLLVAAVARVRAGSLGEGVALGVPSLILMPGMAWMRHRYFQRARRAEAAALRQLNAAEGQRQR